MRISTGNVDLIIFLVVTPFLNLTRHSVVSVKLRRARLNRTEIWPKWKILLKQFVSAAQQNFLKVCSCEGHTMYRLVNLSRAPWDLVPSEGRDHIEWRVKGLPTYLVYGSHEKLNSLCIYLFLKILYNSNDFIYFKNSNYRQLVLKLSPNFL